VFCERVKPIKQSVCKINYYNNLKSYIFRLHETTIITLHVSGIYKNEIIYIYIYIYIFLKIEAW